MANEKKYVSLENLSYYDQKQKAWVTGKDDALKAELQAKIDTANKAIEDEVTRAKAQEATNATSAQNAQSAADKAQGDVDALKTYTGTIPAESSSKTVIEYVQEKTKGIATDTALNELQSAVDVVEADVATIKGDYLKNADKTELQGKIDTVDQKTKTNADAIAEVKADVDAFLADADMSENAKDTLKELQEYIASDESGAAAMAASIQKNETAITGLQETVAKKAEQSALDEEVTARTNADTALDTRVKVLESAVGESRSIATDIDKAKEEAIASATATAAADATEKADKALTDAKAYTNAEVAKDRTRLDAVEALAAANKAAHEANASAIALKADKTALDEEIARAKAAEVEAKEYADGLNTALETKVTANTEAINAFTALSQAEIDKMFV